MSLRPCSVSSYSSWQKIRIRWGPQHHSFFVRQCVIHSFTAKRSLVSPLLVLPPHNDAAHSLSRRASASLVPWLQCMLNARVQPWRLQDAATSPHPRSPRELTTHHVLFALYAVLQGEAEHGGFGYYPPDKRKKTNAGAAATAPADDDEDEDDDEPPPLQENSDEDDDDSGPPSLIDDDEEEEADSDAGVPPPLIDASDSDDGGPPSLADNTDDSEDEEGGDSDAPPALIGEEEEDDEDGPPDLVESSGEGGGPEGEGGAWGVRGGM